MQERGRHEIRACYDDETITVFQAYNDAIADAALKAQRFVSPFRLERMTWIKPSFNWMLYRCGCASKPDQTRVLAVRLSRAGFETALAQATLSSFHETEGLSHDDWRAQLDATDVRIQWDPERDDRLQPMEHIRSLQLGLKGQAARRYASEWIVSITDVTDAALKAGADLRAGGMTGGTEGERRYPVSEALAQRILPRGSP